MIELYDAAQLKVFAEKHAPLTHPYQAWRGYKNQAPIRLLDSIVCELARKNIPGYDKRLNQARKDHAPDAFYGLLAELKFAKLLVDKGVEYSFLHVGENPSPDFCVKVDTGEIYVEVTMHRKLYPALQACEEALQKIDSRFRFSRKYGLRPIYEGWKDRTPFPPTKNIYKTIRERLACYTGKPLATHAVPVWGNPQVHNLYGALVDENLESEPDPDNAHGDDRDSTAKFIQEVLDAKKDKNNLKNSRPNVLWVEGLWITEWQTAEMGRVPWNTLKWPEEIDALVLTVCGIDSAYSPESVKCINLRSGLEEVNKKRIQSFLSKLFPNWLNDWEVVS
jgi:hypothetical protein